MTQLDASMSAALQLLPTHLSATVRCLPPPIPLGVAHPAAETAVLSGYGGVGLGAAGGATPIVVF